MPDDDTPTVLGHAKLYHWSMQVNCPDCGAAAEQITTTKADRGIVWCAQGHVHAFGPWYLNKQIASEKDLIW